MDRIGATAKRETAADERPASALALSLGSRSAQIVPRTILSPSDWCGREDSNFHGLSATATSTLRVYQFRHDRT
ncbi:MAG: hypothetical protein QOH81_2196 [Sphingomonadales bacterium]|nr:hypothetical protein [Sphingomonadales bacterium]